jgi:MFS family permease
MLVMTICSYFLTVTSFQPLYGKLSDILGRKPALLFAYAVFGLGCLGCGLSRNMDELIASRALAGVGGGGLTTVVAVLMSDIVPLRERGTWQGIINVIYGASAGVGATGGGFLADTIGWRWLVFRSDTTLRKYTDPSKVLPSWDRFPFAH